MHGIVWKERGGDEIKKKGCKLGIAGDDMSVPGDVVAVDAETRDSRGVSLQHVQAPAA